MRLMAKKLKLLLDIWSITGFSENELSEFANRQLIDETRDGLKIMSVLLFLMVMIAYSISTFKISTPEIHHYQNYFLVMVLSIHINLSASTVKDIKTLHVLGMTLLIISATAFVLIAHQTGKFNPLLIANIILLFMTTPLIPWGLKEALTIITSIYLMLTLSTISVSGRFEPQAIWSLQFFILAGCITSLVLVIRGTTLRKREIISHFKLKKAHAELYKQSNQDALTGAWNRRYMKTALDELTRNFSNLYQTLHFVIFDLDGFKVINDVFGHEFGDYVLKITSETFQEMLGDKGYLIRIGGDEFVMLMIDQNPELIIQDCLYKIRARVKKIKPNAIFGLSWGIESVPLQGIGDLEKLYQKADKSLYIKKKFSRIKAVSE